MPGPMTGVRFIHCAIEREAAAIEADAGAIVDAAAAAALAARVAFFERVDELHTEGEEIAIFPPLEERLKHQAEPYLVDHARDRVLFREIHGLLAQLVHADAPEPKVKARLMRQTAALADALALHIRKENEILARSPGPRGVSERPHAGHAAARPGGRGGVAEGGTGGRRLVRPEGAAPRAAGLTLGSRSGSRSGSFVHQRWCTNGFTSAS